MIQIRKMKSLLKAKDQQNIRIARALLKMCQNGTAFLQIHQKVVDGIPLLAPLLPPAIHHFHHLIQIRALDIEVLPAAIIVEVVAPGVVVLEAMNVDRTGNKEKGIRLIVIVQDDLIPIQDQEGGHVRVLGLLLEIAVQIKGALITEKEKVENPDANEL